MSLLNTKTKIALIFAAVGLILYANSLNNQMFWDDQDIILNNQYVQNFDWPKFFSENQIAGAGLTSNYWRPLMLTAFSIEWQLWNDWAPGYHLINLLLHIANTILLYSITVRLFRLPWVSFLTSLIFLIHPLQTEAVTYVSGLADVLSTFFIFLGILFYCKFRLTQNSGHNFRYFHKYYGYTLLCYIAAILSKDTAVVMPAMLALTDFFALPSELTVKQRLFKVVKNIWPFFLLAGLYLLLRATALNFSNTFNVYGEENLFTENFGVRLLAFFRAMAIYFQLLFWPNNLHMERGFDIPHNLLIPDVFVGGFLVFGLITAAFLCIKKYPIISFGIFWFFIRLFPNSNLLIPNSGLIYEHWMYVPMIGIFLVMSYLALNVAEAFRPPLWKPKGFRYILALLLIFYLAILGKKTIARNNDWQDPITFYNQTLKYSQTYRVLNNLGMAYADAKLSAEAIETYQKAINLDAHNAVAYHNLGNSYKEIGNRGQAVKNFETAIEKQPDFFFSYYALAQLYLDEKNYASAISVLEKLQKLNPADQKIARLIEQIKRLRK